MLMLQDSRVSAIPVFMIEINDKKNLGQTRHYFRRSLRTVQGKTWLIPVGKVTSASRARVEIYNALCDAHKFERHRHHGCALSAGRGKNFPHRNMPGS